MTDFNLWLFIFTKIINTESFFFVLLLIAYGVWRRRSTRSALIVVITTVFTALSILGLKTFFAVERPAGALIELESYAFPSGHATGILFLAIVLWWYVTHFYRWSRVWSGLGFLTFAALVGYSRLYLGVHTETQVLAGYALGLSWGILFLFLMRK